jgi:hypothetical protein
MAIRFTTTVDGSILCDERDLEYRLSTVDTYLAGEFISSRAPAAWLRGTG